MDALIEKGAKVATCGRNHDKLYRLQSEFPSADLHTMVADVSNENDCRRFIETTIKVFGGIDILINNAGISMRALLKETSTEVIRKVMDINFYGTVYCTKYALDSIDRKKRNNCRCIIYCRLPWPAGKKRLFRQQICVQGWLEAIKTELMADGVHVMWVCPGFTTSNIRNAALNKEGHSHGETPMDEGKMMTCRRMCGSYFKGNPEKEKNPGAYIYRQKNCIYAEIFSETGG